MAYSFGGRVRYSEIGENGLLTLPGILNYFLPFGGYRTWSRGPGRKEKMLGAFRLAGDCQQISRSE